MITTDKSGVSFFIELCVQQGLKKVVFSPGSRNAPLVIAMDEHPSIETVIIHDERSAAFFAMGMALELNEPVAVVCTSGSAMLNYYPAVAEAFYQCIPLVVISADRPAEWINHGDGQTIVQSEVYTNHIRKEITLKEFVESEKEKSDMTELVNSAFDLCKGEWRGPIHVNVPLSEPLYNTIEKEGSNELRVPSKEKSSLSLEDIDFMEANWSRFKKKMIVCGQMPENKSLLNRLIELSTDSSVAILVENTSNLKHSHFIHCIDRTLAGIDEKKASDFHPDLLITIGGAVISKKIKHFLRKIDNLTHWKVGAEFPKMDTYRALSHSFPVDPSLFFNNLLKMNLPSHVSTFGNKWKQLDFLIQEDLRGYFDRCEYTDLSVFETILDYIPENSNLHMGNSSVVRYCQLFDPIHSLNYFSNRGTSGIDGSTSTAAGVACVSKGKCNVIITGDISFFYDSNALWNDFLTDNLRIILINNGGGGIFKIIDGPGKTNQLEKYFEAKHNYSAENLAKAFNIEYYGASSISEIESQMPSFYSDSTNERPKLIEIFTPSMKNDAALKEFFNAIKSH